MSEPLPPTGPAPRTPSIMNRIVASSLRQRFLIALMTLVLIGAGTRSLDRLPVDAYPDLSPPMVEVITQWPGHAAEEVERLITVPVEREMNGIAQHDRRSARSRSTDCPTSSSRFKMARTITSPASRFSTGLATSVCRAA